MSLHDVRRGTGKDKRNGRKPQHTVTAVDLDLIPDNQVSLSTFFDADECFEKLDRHKKFNFYKMV